MNILKKVSARTVFGTPDDIRESIAEGGGKCGIMRVVGIAVGTKSDSSQYGEWVALRGQFSATNLQTGEQFRGSTLFAPDEFIDMVAAQLSNASSVEFAVDIGAVKSDIVIGYEYTVTPLIEVSESDPLAKIEAAVEKKLLESDAKKPATKKTTAKK